MKLFQTFSRAFSITVFIYLILISVYFLTGFEFFPKIMFSFLGVFSLFSLAFIDITFISLE